jgi:hypothetical protein
VPWTILVPASLPTGTVVSGFTADSFRIEVDGGGRDVRADLNTTAGSATLVYQIDRTANVVTITPVDITTTAGVTASTTNLIAGARAKVFGVPQLDGSTKADAVFFYTRTLPADTIQSVLASGLRRSWERPAGGAVSRRLWVPGELPATEDV